MRRTILTLILFSVINLAYGQVETKKFPNNDALKQLNYVRNYPNENKVKTFPSFDAQKLIDEENIDVGLDAPFRFGKGFDTKISLADGEWTDIEGGRLWSLRFQSKGAYSINFVFNQFFLPEGAELYISNFSESVLYGPVTSKVNTKSGFFLTDLVQGDDVTIFLFEPTNMENKSKLIIKRVIHAYKNLFQMGFRDLGSSGACNNDIACFSAWDEESDAVALVLLAGGDELCSGSLLMTAGQTFEPYFLSAFHCIDASKDGSLSSTEIFNAENWMFKFQYKMTSCGGSTATTGITYNGAEFRAGWGTSDFVLMEMNNSPLGDTRFSWLGWDRIGTAPTSGTGIHHPSGDVMKISFDHDAIPETFKGSSVGGSGHWYVDIENGTLENGSSGSPLFNEDKRVVGQLHSGYPGCSSSKQFWYGCFHRSWTGGGTNETRLSNWLDPCGSGALITNTARTPYISGPSTVCSTGATFTVTNLPSGYSVTWDKSSNLTYISGQNTNSYVVKSNGIGPAWVQAAINGSCVGTVNLTTGDIWSGLPSGYEIDGPSVIQLNNSTPYHYIATGNGYSHLQGISSIGWTSSTNIGFVYGTNGQYDAYARGLSVGDGTINFYTTNNCGTTTFDYLVWISKNPRMTIYPNPATDIITVTIDSSNEMLETSLVKKTEIKYSGSYEIQIWNERQGLVRIIRDSKSTEQISLEGLSKGMYYLHLVKNKETLQKQLFWII
jgi:lysyl endopeptidase